MVEMRGMLVLTYHELLKADDFIYEVYHFVVSPLQVNTLKEAKG